MKKRISALLMALMLAVGMLSGCDNTSINSSDSGKTKVILATDTQTQDDSLNNKTQVVDNDDSTNITTKAQKSNKSANSSKNESNKSKATKSSKSTKIPEYNGKAYVELNGNNPEFKSKEITDKSFEKYGSLDSLGRCTVCVASVGKEIMPTEKRGEIGMVKPTGWRTVKYDFVDGKYLYNRCHLIGYQLTGENANEKNLITGTRYLNVTGVVAKGRFALRARPSRRRIHRLACGQIGALRGRVVVELDARYASHALRIDQPAQHPDASAALYCRLDVGVRHVNAVGVEARIFEDGPGRSVGKVQFERAIICVMVGEPDTEGA